MNFRSIDDIKKNLKYSTIFVFIFIFILINSLLAIIHLNFEKKQEILKDQKILNAQNNFILYFAEKLSITSSSDVFIDYLRSGNMTRSNLYIQFLSQLSSLNFKGMLGMKLVDEKNQNFFSIGSTSNSYINLKLCYLNEHLDSQLGECKFTWKIYIDKGKFIENFLDLNKDIEVSPDGKRYDFFSKKYFGNFPLSSSSGLATYLSINNSNDLFYYFYLLLTTTTILLLATWSLYRLNFIINNYIKGPIIILGENIKSDLILESKNNIKEINFLIDEINNWKVKLRKKQEDINAAKIGKIALLIAHDIRSPLAVIDMIVKNLKGIPANSRKILKNATLRISDIASDLLHQYKSDYIHNDQTSVFHMASALHNLVIEKKGLCNELSIKINFKICSSAYDIFCSVDLSDFSRVISNLIDNAIESIRGMGIIFILLKKVNDSLVVTIFDNGCGMPENLQLGIMQGGVSNKKGGFGLGLSQSVKVIENMRGKILVNSKENHGTQIDVSLPIEYNKPSWFGSNIEIKNNKFICILDDDSVVFELLKKRLIKNDRKSEVNIKFFDSVNEIKKYIEASGNNKHLYIFDPFTFNETEIFKFMKDLNITDQTIFVSNQIEDLVLHSKCEDLKIKIIPKVVLSYIPIRIIDL